MSRSSGSVDMPSSALPSGPRLRSALRAPVPRTRTAPTRTHVLTVALEDYFHADSFRRWIHEETWYRYEDRLPKSTHRVLDLLDRCEARATFFVGRSTAHSAPEL